MLYLLLLFVLTGTLLEAAPEETKDRDGKFLPVLQIVTFENTACPADDGSIGTCFSEKECTNQEGMASGRCANSFGVCCVVHAHPGHDITINNTYVVNEGYPSTDNTPGMRTHSIYPPENVNYDSGRNWNTQTSLNNNKQTCQILLTFDQFDILGPSQGDCNNDTWTFIGANPGLDIPVLCGYNAGQHMYIDVDNSPGPYEIVTMFSSMAYARSYKIRVTFIECTNDCHAPSRCLQYHTTPSGTFSSFNYAMTSPQMLNNLKYSICFAYIKDYCDTAVTFSRFDFGNINGNCNNDYVQAPGQMLCGDYSTTTTQMNATNPGILHVSSDSNNDNLEEGFSGSYMMAGC